MINRFIILFLFFSFFNECSGQNVYSLKGQVNSEQIYDTAYLKIFDRYSENAFTREDTCLLQNNYFAFTGELPKYSETAVLYFIGKSGRKQLSFVLDCGTNLINVNISEKGQAPMIIGADSVLSASNLLYLRLTALQKTYEELYGTYVEDLTNGGRFKVLNDIDKINELYHKELLILSKYPATFYSLIRLYPLLHRGTFRKDPIELVNVFLTFSDEVRNTELGIEFYIACKEILNANKQSSIGHPVILFKVATPSGLRVDNSTLMGSPYIIAFSATWCIPCKIYEKELLKLYSSYNKLGLNVFYFNLDDNVPKWKQHIKDNKSTWLNVSESVKFENSKIAKEFNVFSIPVYLLVDKKGIIVYNSDELKDQDFLLLEPAIINALE